MWTCESTSSPRAKMTVLYTTLRSICGEMEAAIRGSVLDERKHKMQGTCKIEDDLSADDEVDIPRIGMDVSILRVSNGDAHATPVLVMVAMEK